MTAIGVLDLDTGAQCTLAELPPVCVIRDFDVSHAATDIVIERSEVNSHVALIERRP